MRVDETYEAGALVRTLTHHGDGTGTLAVLTGGEWVESAVSGLPVAEPDPPSDADRIAELESILADLLDLLGGQ